MLITTPYGLGTTISAKDMPLPFELEKVEYAGKRYNAVYSDGKRVYCVSDSTIETHSLTKFKRAQKFVVNDEPKNLRIYDNGGETQDRYTIVFTGKYKKDKDHNNNTWYKYMGLSENPYYPTGVCEYGEAKNIIDRPTYSHLGKKIPYSKLPFDCKKLVVEYYAALWGFEMN